MHVIFVCTGTRSLSCPFIQFMHSPLQHFQLPTAIRLGEAGGHEATEVLVREEGMERRRQFKFAVRDAQEMQCYCENKLKNSEAADSKIHPGTP